MKRFLRLAGEDVLRDVLRLVSGTLGGRLILLVAMPIVTRLYSPDDFALLSVYMGLVGIIAVVACLRFDIAIPVAGDESDAAHLLVLALISAAAFAAVCAVVVLVFPQELAQFLGLPRLAPWLWLVPLGVVLASAYSALQFWATRARRFGSIAVTRITQAAAGAGTMLGLGWAGGAPLGLLLGNMLSIGAGSLRLGLDLIRCDKHALRQVTISGLGLTFRRYRRYPIYSTPEALANTVGIQIPVMMVAAFAGVEAGFLIVAQQIMAAPMALLGASVSQVYVSRAPEALRDGRLAEFTTAILRRLMLVGLAPLLLAGLLAPTLLPLIFGTQWVRSGEIVTWMVPWIVLQFLASPISLVMFVTGRQRNMLMLTLFGAALRIGAVGIATLVGPGMIVAAYAGASAIFYGACLLVFTDAAGLAWRGWVSRIVLMLMMVFLAYAITSHLISG